jgi:hypothetical protein
MASLVVKAGRLVQKVADSDSRRLVHARREVRRVMEVEEG